MIDMMKRRENKRKRRRRKKGMKKMMRCGWKFRSRLRQRYDEEAKYWKTPNSAPFPHYYVLKGGEGMVWRWYGVEMGW